MPSSAIPLEILYNLDIIIKAIGNAELSKTRLKNSLPLSLDALSSSLEYGCEHGFLDWAEYNKYKVKQDFVISEESFYPAINQGILRLWQDEKYEPHEFYLEETARRDSKIAGPWTRPDFTLISHKKFPWTIGSEFDVVTFEVKRPDNCNVLAVFEALSHASAATRAYVVFPIDASAWSETNQQQEARVKEECARHGVGLILMEKIYANPSPLHVIKASKREIDHEKCSSFLSAVVSDRGKEEISRWK